MKRLNHYQTDILFVFVIMVLQLAFTIIYPFRNPGEIVDIAVSTRFVGLEFEFVNLAQTSFYLPILAVIYVVFLMALLIQKRRRYALIYGFGIALVAKASYITQLYGLAGNTYQNMRVDGFLSQRVVANGEIIAQNITFYVLAVLLVVKIAIYVHDMVMKRRLKDTTPK